MTRASNHLHDPREAIFRCQCKEPCRRKRSANPSTMVNGQATAGYPFEHSEASDDNAAAAPHAGKSPYQLSNAAVRPATRDGVAPQIAFLKRRTTSRDYMVIS